MTLLSLPALTPPEIYVIGDVIIHDRAVVAAGSILQATQGHQIVIEEGACIGMGTVITASEGDLVIGKGVILGAGVLVVGSGRIGDHACIGSASTLWNSSVAAMAIVPPGSLLGDRARSITEETSTSNGNIPEAMQQETMFTAEEDGDPWQEPISEVSPSPSHSPVIGQVYINQMLYSLFPGRKPPPPT